jgi:hypothetical protein
MLTVFGARALLAAEAVVYQVNDRIESNLSVFGWQKGTVVEVGQGDKAEQVKILTDGNAAAGWVSVNAMKFVRKIPGVAPAVPTFDANQPPRLGKYNILSFGVGGKNLFLGHLELLAGGKYRVSRTGIILARAPILTMSRPRRCSGSAVLTKTRPTGVGDSKFRVRAKPTPSGCDAARSRRIALTSF